MPDTDHRKRATAAALAVAVTVAGCGASHSTPAPAPPTTSLIPPTTKPAPSPTAAAPSSSTSTSSTTTSPSSDGRASCPTSRLSISDRPASAGLGHFGTVLVFTNHGAPCTLTGYPGVDGVRDGTSVVHAQRTLNGYLGGTTSTTTVTLPAGGSASALLEGFDGPEPGHECASYTSLLVTPPNDRQAVTLTVRAPLCSPQIHPVVAGAAGS